MKILVTGATGFIGKCVISHFSDKHEIFGTCRALKKGKFIQADLINLSDYGVFDVDFDVVIHCASILATPKNRKNINLLLDNVKITESVQKIAELNKVELIINLSSIGVYPCVNGIYNEESLIRPSDNYEGLYGLSKFCSEELFLLLNKDNHTRIVNLRLGQTLGKGMRNDRIYSIMRDELKKGNVISVWGEGERISSFLTIDYLLKYLTLIIKNKTIKGTFNLSEKNISYKELADEIIFKYGNEKSKIKLIKKGSRSKIKIDSGKLMSKLH